MSARPVTAMHRTAAIVVIPPLLPPVPGAPVVALLRHCRNENGRPRWITPGAAVSPLFQIVDRRLQSYDVGVAAGVAAPGASTTGLAPTTTAGVAIAAGAGVAAGAPAIGVAI